MTKHQAPLRERFPALGRILPEWAYHALVSFVGEFLGTVFFLFFALAGCQVAYTHLSPSTVVLPGSPALSTMGISAASLLYAALAVGFSMIVNAWIFFRISSALFNPAITFGMVLEGKLTWKKGLSLVVAQFLAGMAAAGLVSGLLPGQLTAETLLGNGTSVVRGLFIEILLTSAFVFSVFMLATEKHRGTSSSPVGIGLTLFVTQLVGGPFTGASLNPARSFCTAVAARHFPGYHWIYWLGPALGSLLAVGFYKVVKVLEIETALAIHGGNFLGHRRGISNSSNVPADAALREVHVLDPVPESDLEKGLKTPGAEGKSTVAAAGGHS